MSLIKNPIFGGPKEGLAKFKITMELAGVSSDQKPTNVEKYTLFLELDTLDIYYYGDDGWLKCGESGGGNNIYLLNAETVTMSYQDGFGYACSNLGSTFNADAKTALETLTGGGTYPTLTITCPELSIDGVTLEWSLANDEWEDEQGVIILAEENNYSLGIVSENVGAPLTATITLSFPEPEA